MVWYNSIYKKEKKGECPLDKRMEREERGRGGRGREEGEKKKKVG
jgi:hypothetical protein